MTEVADALLLRAVTAATCERCGTSVALAGVARVRYCGTGAASVPVSRTRP